MAPLRLDDRAALVRLVQRADELGYDVVAAPDHLGMGSPFGVLRAVASISERMRLRTYVLNVGFWNPALLAREIATLDVWSGGRVDAGLGAGHMKAEHDDARLPWPPLRERVTHLEDMIVELRRRLAAEDHRPHPVQQPVPIMVGAMSAAGLDVAARHADIIGFAGARQVGGQPPGTFTVVSWQETQERVDQVRATAAGRGYQSDILLQFVSVDEEPASVAARLAVGTPVSAEQLLGTPFVLLARTPEQAADDLLHRCEVFGVTSITTHQPSLEALGAVIAAIRARGR